MTENHDSDRDQRPDNNARPGSQSGQPDFGTTAGTGQQQAFTPEPPHADPATLRSAYAFDGSGPWLYAPDGSGPYAYTYDGRGPYLMGTPPLAGNTGLRGAQAQAAYGPSATAGASFGLGNRHHPRRRLGIMIGAGVAALAIVGVAGGTASGYTTRNDGSTTSSQSQSSTGSGLGGSEGQSNSNGYGTLPGQGGSSSDDGSSGSSSQSSATAATDSQKAGIVTIVSTLDYDSSSQAAGTGMIISSDGEILTNNHVIEDATSIDVTVETTGKTYKADVVGTDATDDIAVLKLENASGLTTADLDSDNDLTVGDSITDVGNANGTGNLVAAEGTVSALDKSITVQDDSGSGTESLSGLIEVSADVVSGDSGGPVLDSDGEVVGIATAASSGSEDVTGYAIPITTAKTIAEQILQGKATSSIVIGLPAFLGVQVSSTTTSGTSGVTIAGTVTGSPAAKAGLAEGDVITSVDGTAVTSADELTTTIKKHAVGDSISVVYTDTAGTSHTVTATLVGGPAD